jgi:hypothetical protein
MKKLLIQIVFSLMVIVTILSCSKNYGYEFEDGVNTGAEEATGKVDTNMSFVDRSLFNRARVFPGVVGAAEPRLQNQKLVMDLNYVPAKDLRVNVSPYGIHSTGFYAATGELVKIIVPEGVDGLVVQIGCHTDNLTGKIDLRRDPVIVTSKALFPGANYIRSLYGGVVWIKSRYPITNPVELTFSNVVESPDFVLGETTNEEWFEKIRKTTVPWLEFRGKQVVYSVPRTIVMDFLNRGRINDPTKLMEEWDKVYEKDYYNWMGLIVNNPNHKHRAPDLPERGVVDIQISVGYGHNGYPWMGTMDNEWTGTMIDLSVMMSGQGWGTWHEVGHNYQQGNWSWDGLGETTNNLFIFKTANRLTKETGDKIFPQHPAVFEQLPLAIAFASSEGVKDFDKNDNPFWKLTPFLQLFNKVSNPTTGEDGWALMAYLYTKTRNATRLSNNIQDRKDFFYESVSEYTQTDFFPFMQAWGINVSLQSRRAIAAKGYPKLRKEIWKYDPISNTGGDTDIPTKFDYARTSWSIVGFSTEEPNEGAAPQGRAVAVLDGDLNTFWHTQWSGTDQPPPHHIIIDMKEEIDVKGFFFYLRQNSANGRPRNIEILVSADNQTWRSLGTHDLANSTARQEVVLSGLEKFQYMRFNFNDQNHVNNVHATMAEIGVFYDE